MTEKHGHFLCAAGIGFTDYDFCLYKATIQKDIKCRKCKEWKLHKPMNRLKKRRPKL